VRSLPAAAKHSIMGDLKLLTQCSRGLCYFWQYLAHVFSWLLKFQDNILVQSSRVKQSRPTMECYMIFFESRKTGSGAFWQHTLTWIFQHTCYQIEGCNPQGFQ
jgi:hypothetical protein